MREREVGSNQNPTSVCFVKGKKKSGSSNDDVFLLNYLIKAKKVWKMMLGFFSFFLQSNNCDFDVIGWFNLWKKYNYLFFGSNWILEW